MYSPLRCCSGYLDYTLHAVLLLNENYDIGQRSNVLLYIGEKSKKKKKKKKKGGKEGINYAFNCRIESDSFANCITIFLTAACGFYFYHGHCYYRDRNFLCEIRQILLCIFSGYL